MANENPFDVLEQHQDAHSMTSEIKVPTEGGSKAFRFIIVALVLIILCLIAGLCMYFLVFLPAQQNAGLNQLMHDRAVKTVTAAAATLAAGLTQTPIP